jgi:hypothetical protein
VIAHSQGTTLVFDGVTVTKITNVSTGGGSVAMVDATAMNAIVVGSGLSKRVILQDHPGNVSLGTVEVNVLGPQGLGMDDEGRIGRLILSWAGGGVNTFATLTSCKMTGGVNDVIRGSLTFKLTG